MSPKTVHMAGLFVSDIHVRSVVTSAVDWHCEI